MYGLDFIFPLFHECQSSPTHPSPEFCAGDEAWWRTVDVIAAKFEERGGGERQGLWGRLRKSLGLIRSFHQGFVAGNGLGFGVWGLGFGVWGSGFEVCRRVRGCHEVRL